MTIQQIMQIIQPLVQDVLWPLALLLLPLLYHKLKAALPANRAALLDSIVQHAVQMVEQKFGNMTPEEKRKEAEMAIYNLAKFFGYDNLDPTVVNTILESFVWETKQAKVVQGTLAVPEIAEVNKPQQA